MALLIKPLFYNGFVRAAEKLPALALELLKEFVSGGFFIWRDVIQSYL
jgi:hypothetical protein